MLKKFFNKPIIVFCFVFYLLTTLLIFISSLTDGEISGEQSAFVWSILSTILNIEGNYELFIRKILGHFFCFLVLAIFATVVYYRLVEILFTTYKSFWFVFITLLVGLLTAIFSEILQLPLFVDGRNGNFLDIVIDFCGYFLGFILLRFVIYRKVKNQ